MVINAGRYARTDLVIPYAPSHASTLFAHKGSQVLAA